MVAGTTSLFPLPSLTTASGPISAWLRGALVRGCPLMLLVSGQVPFMTLLKKGHSPLTGGGRNANKYQLR